MICLERLSETYANHNTVLAPILSLVLASIIAVFWATLRPKRGRSNSIKNDVLYRGLGLHLWRRILCQSDLGIDKIR